jgi:hypothetical protein
MIRPHGADQDEIVGAFPERMLRGLGYFGPAAGAAEAVRTKVAGTDTAVTPSSSCRRGVEAIRAILGACRPLFRRP